MQGEGLNQSATCAFGNATYVQTVTAQVSDAGNVTCIAHEWPAMISNRTNGMRLGLPILYMGAVTALS